MRFSSDWAGCSRRLLACAALALVGLAGPAGAKVFLNQREAFEVAFPGSDRVESRTYVLTPEQVEVVEDLAKSRLPTKIVTIHTGWRDEALLGYAFFDVHTVRTLAEAFLVVLDSQGEVRTLRVLAFHEPLEYLPTRRWYEQFAGKRSSSRLRLGQDIQGIVGATLSARAATQGVRRALAFHRVLVLQSE